MKGVESLKWVRVTSWWRHKPLRHETCALPPDWRMKLRPVLAGFSSLAVRRILWDIVLKSFLRSVKSFQKIMIRKLFENGFSKRYGIFEIFLSKLISEIFTWGYSFWPRKVIPGKSRDLFLNQDLSPSILMGRSWKTHPENLFGMIPL